MRYLQAFYQYKFLILLFALLLFFLVNPFLVDNHAAMFVFNLLFSLVIFTSVVIVKRSKSIVCAVVILACLAFMGIWFNSAFPVETWSMLAESILVACFFLLMTGLVLADVIADRVITFNTLCGAICGYLLIGLSLSFIYSILFFCLPSAFALPAQGSQTFDTNSLHFIYYSFVVLTTLGLGDITPVSAVARTFSWLEAVAGQIYLTVWIAQLVGLHIVHTQKHQGDSQ